MNSKSRTSKVLAFAQEASQIYSHHRRDPKIAARNRPVMSRTSTPSDCPSRPKGQRGLHRPRSEKRKKKQDWHEAPTVPHRCSWTGSAAVPHQRPLLVHRERTTGPPRAPQRCPEEAITAAAPQLIPGEERFPCRASAKPCASTGQR